MFWYGISMLFILFTLFAHLIEGESGIGSARTTHPVAVSDTVIHVSSLSGFPNRMASARVGGEDISYAGTGTSASDGCTEEPPCLLMVSRGTAAAAHAEGTPVLTEAAADLNSVAAFRIGEVDSIWGTLTYPFQLAGVFGRFVAKTVVWDYDFLEGGLGLWVKIIILYPLSAATVFALLRLFVDAASILGLRR